MRPVSEHEIASAATDAGWKAVSATRLQSREAETWSIDGHQIVVRVATRDRLDVERSNLNVMLAVHAAGVPTPEPLHIASSGDLVFTYSRQVPNVQQPMDVRMAGLGSTLACLHRSQVQNSRLWDARPRKQREVTRMELLHGPRVAGEVNELWQSALHNFDRATAGMPKVFVHSDAHPGNVLHDKDGSPVLIDWEGAGVGPAVADLAKSAASFKRQPADRVHEGAFWDGYGGRVDIPVEAIRLHEVSEIIWMGSLSATEDAGAAREFFHRMNTLGVDAADWHKT